MLVLRPAKRYFSTTITRLMLSPLQEYDLKVKSGKLRDDQYQRGIISSLGSMHDALTTYTPPKIVPPNPLDQKKSLWGRLFGQKKKTTSYGNTPKGIYLYGDVGCGKTMLMDLFYDCVPEHLTKKRIHFHQFMQYVHKRQHEIVKEQNASKDLDTIPFLAAEIANNSKVLCFDEFQVTDVADAMILRRLLMTLLDAEHGVVLFATSNRAPDELYMNGVQRESFIPCIEALKQRTEVILLDSPTDYRKIPRPVSSVYFHHTDFLNPAVQELAQEHVHQWYDYFSQGKEVMENVELQIWGRTLTVPHSSPPNVAQFTFKELCGNNLAAGDYLALATAYNSFIVTDIPYLSIFVRDEVRRFITFLDAVYDNHGRLAVTSVAPFQDLFVEPDQLVNDYQLKENIEVKEDDAEEDELVSKHGFSKKVAKSAKIFALDEERFAFARALSRLSHMSTQDWVENVRH